MQAWQIVQPKDDAHPRAKQAGKVISKAPYMVRYTEERTVPAETLTDGGLADPHVDLAVGKQVECVDVTWDIDGATTVEPVTGLNVIAS